MHSFILLIHVVLVLSVTYCVYYFFVSCCRLQKEEEAAYAGSNQGAHSGNSSVPQSKPEEKRNGQKSHAVPSGKKFFTTLAKTTLGRGKSVGFLKMCFNIIYSCD